MSSELQFNPLSANFTKWSNTLKQFVAKLPTNRLSMFDHVVGLALKGLTTKIFIDLNHSTSEHSSYTECTYDNDMTSRSSHRRCTLKKVFLKILQNLQENSCVRVSFLIVAGLWQITSFHRTPPGEYLWTYWTSHQLLTYVQIKNFIQGVVAFLKKTEKLQKLFWVFIITENRIYNETPLFPWVVNLHFTKKWKNRFPLYYWSDRCAIKTLSKI